MSLNLIEGFETGGAGDRAPSTTRDCPGCGIPFQPSKRNQRYCLPSCQKKASRNSARGSTSASDSPDRRYVKRRQRATLAWLNETYYATPPGARLALLKAWLDAARGGDTHLRGVLSRPDFAKADHDRATCFRNSRAYPPVPYLADRFSQRLLNCRVWDWVSGCAGEPETGEVENSPVPHSDQVREIHPHLRGSA